jgi:hypothetical protein
MNVAGKSLQDIYDAGSKRLEELESAETTALNDTAEAHLDERMRVEPESLKRLEERTEELEKELRAFLARGLERVEKAVAGEGQENERHIARLVEGLVLLSKKFSESIGQLREAAESELSDLAGDSQFQYHASSDSVTNKLKEESSSALDATRSGGAQSESTIAEKTDYHWRMVHDSESEAVKTVTEGFHEYTESTNRKGNDARRALEEAVDTKLLSLEGKLSQASDNIRSVVDTVTETAERHAFDADVRLKEKFSSLLYEMSTSFDDSATRAAVDMAGLHESSMADLTMRSQELSREMDSLAEEVTAAASGMSEKLQGNGKEMVQRHTDELTKRLETSNEFLKEIEAERAQLVSEIWNELTEVKQKFEERLTNLANNTLEKMRGICEEAETAVTTAQQNCLDESKNHSTAKRDAIEKEAADFIDRVSSTRQAALDAIAKAAGATTDEGGESRSEKKGKKGAAAAATAAATEEATSEPVEATDADTEEDAEQTESSEDDDHTNPRPADAEGVTEPRKKKKSGKGSDKRSGDRR